MELARVPKDVSRVILQHGIMVQLLTVSGTPKLDGAGNVINPLTGTEYRIRFTGEKGVEMESSMTLGRTIWFEGNMLDSSTSPSPHQWLRGQDFYTSSTYVASSCMTWLQKVAAGKTITCVGRIYVE